MMNLSHQSIVESGGGAVFQGDITAGRDITINHFTEIHQAAKGLFDHCCDINASERLLSTLSALEVTAGFIEEYARDLQLGIAEENPQLKIIVRECNGINSDLRLFSTAINSHGEGSLTAEYDFQCEQKISDIRLRLISLHTSLSVVNNKKVMEDQAIIKAILSDYIDAQTNAREPSISSFQTASSTPYAERQMWSEIESGLRHHGFTAEMFKENYALIVSTLESTLLDRAMAGFELRQNISGSTEAASSSQRTSQDSTISQHVDDEKRSPRLEPAFRPTAVGAWHKLQPDDPWSVLLLTFDGGGVRTYSSLLLMLELMKEIADCENAFERKESEWPRQFEANSLRPCHYFDRIYGTSSGGIAAIAFGRLRMSVSDFLDSFPDLMTDMFGHRRKPLPLTAKYDHRPFEMAMQRLVMAYCPVHSYCDGIDLFLWDPTDAVDLQSFRTLVIDAPKAYGSMCQSICVATTRTGQFHETQLLRSYNHQYDENICPTWVTPYETSTSPLQIWEVARATTAAPFLHQRYRSEGGNDYQDGGIGEFNPSYAAYSEGTSLTGETFVPGILLSIGSGDVRDPKDRLTSGQFFLSLFNLQTLNKALSQIELTRLAKTQWFQGTKIHRFMYTLAKGDHSWYKRLSVKDGFGTLQIDNWEPGFHNGANKPGGKTLQKIEVATQAYLMREDLDKMWTGYTRYAATREMIKHTAEKLVRFRRAREYNAMVRGENREKWDAYMGKHLKGEQDCFKRYVEEWDLFQLHRKEASGGDIS